MTLHSNASRFRPFVPPPVVIVQELTNIAAKQLQRIKDRDAYLSKLIAVDKRVQSSGTNLV